MTRPSASEKATSPAGSVDGTGLASRSSTRCRCAGGFRGVAGPSAASLAVVSSLALRRRRRGSPLKRLVLIVGLLVVLAAAAAGSGAVWGLRIYDSAPALSHLHPRKQSR